MDSKENISIWQKSRTFLQEVKKEVSLVVWPTRKETSLTTMIVCIFAFIMSLYLLFVDRSLFFIVQKILN